MIITLGVGKNQEDAYSVTPNLEVPGTAVMASQEIIVAIFGRWATSREILAKLTDPASQNSCDGSTLINKKTGTVVYEVDIRDRDPELVSSVVSCGAGRLNARSIEAIKDHTHYVVLTGPVGSVANPVNSQMEAALDMLNTVAVLVEELHGAVVHVATAGITHTPEAWVGMNNEQDTTATINAFVQRIGGSGAFFSCGMHAFGYGDACLKASLPATTGAKVLFEFLLYTLAKNLGSDASPFVFNPRAVAGDYRATFGPCIEWEEDSAFFNKFGLWTLTEDDSQN
jgi:hypothetical protein